MLLLTPPLPPRPSGHPLLPPQDYLSEQPCCCTLPVGGFFANLWTLVISRSVSVDEHLPLIKTISTVSTTVQMAEYSKTEFKEVTRRIRKKANNEKGSGRMRQSHSYTCENRPKELVQPMDQSIALAFGSPWLSGETVTLHVQSISIEREKNSE